MAERRAARPSATEPRGEHDVEPSEHDVEPSEHDVASMFGVLLTVAYDGTRFAGYARQPTARTIAGELDGAIRALDPKASLARGASRTDSGVHAHGQRVSFDTRLDIPPRGWALALAQHLSDEVSIVATSRVRAGYDPRDHAMRKTYRYFILRSEVRDPFWQHRAWRTSERLNHDAMAAEAHTLVGTHDFRAFRSSTDSRVDTVRTLVRAEFLSYAVDDRVLVLEITGDRFLHRMMRIIAGTLVDVGRGRLLPGAVTRGIESGNRANLGMTAPPDGLYLLHIELNDEGSDKWPDHLSSR
ncbi:MAG TPA: tRNA pseudouridine(38-40) synthase TruA [Polyangiaceae bacterium]|nr:tRNA pseudouridine(38-40) synthase TruA [Polyangiaceae bacterium]